MKLNPFKWFGKDRDEDFDKLGECKICGYAVLLEDPHLEYPDGSYAHTDCLDENRRSALPTPVQPAEAFNPLITPLDVAVIANLISGSSPEGLGVRNPTDTSVEPASFDGFQEGRSGGAGAGAEWTDPTPQSAAEQLDSTYTPSALDADYGSSGGSADAPSYSSSDSYSSSGDSWSSGDSGSSYDSGGSSGGSDSGGGW